MARYPAHNEKFFSALKGLKDVPAGWESRCPAHDDTNPSLAIRVHEDGWLQMKCFVGCTRDEILKATNCTLADIGPYRPERVERVGGNLPEKVYSYVNEQGQELYQVLRLKPKSFRQRRSDGKGGYVYSLAGSRRVLYRLPELLNNDRVVWLVEGEKDVDNLIALGLVATTNPMGAGKWDDEYSATLKGRIVFIIPDHDPQDAKTGKRPGWEHAKMVATKLIGVAAQVRIVQLDIPEGQDVSDWIAAGGTAEQLKELARQAPQIAHPENIPEYRPQGVPEPPQTPAKRAVRRVRLSPEELSSAAHKGVMRHIWAIKGKSREHDEFRAWSYKIEQACAEQAAKRATHRYFIGLVGSHDDSTKEVLHVRHFPTHDGELVLDGELDGDESMFLFVTGVAPKYQVHGWILGKDGKLEAYKRPDGKYLVPRDKLHDVRELPPELDGDGNDG